jgi:hypothetical protein
MKEEKLNLINSTLTLTQCSVHSTFLSLKIIRENNFIVLLKQSTAAKRRNRKKNKTGRLKFQSLFTITNMCAYMLISNDWNTKRNVWKLYRFPSHHTSIFFKNRDFFIFIFIVFSSKQWKKKKKNENFFLAEDENEVIFEKRKRVEKSIKFFFFSHSSLCHSLNSSFFLYALSWSERETQKKRL